MNSNYFGKAGKKVPITQSPNAKPPQDILEFDKPYRTHDLTELLNKVHLGKFTGEPFIVEDINNFYKRGCLPHIYGGWVLDVRKIRKEIFILIRNKKKKVRYGDEPIYNVD